LEKKCEGCPAEGIVGVGSSPKWYCLKCFEKRLEEMGRAVTMLRNKLQGVKEA